MIWKRLLALIATVAIMSPPLTVHAQSATPAYCSQEWVSTQTGVRGWRANYYSGAPRPDAWELDLAAETPVKAAQPGLLVRRDKVVKTIPRGKVETMKIAAFTCDYAEYDRLNSATQAPVCRSSITGYVLDKEGGKRLELVPNTKPDGSLVEVYALRFVQMDNALVQVMGGRTAPFIWDMTPGTTDPAFVVSAVNDKKAVAIEVVVRDECGEESFTFSLNPVIPAGLPR